jgi:hypothetical protein
MKNLKKRLTADITAINDSHQKSVEITRASLDSLKNFRINNARYVVKLRSLWENDGEENVEIEYKGRLEDAIVTAQDKFKEVNKRGDVQANCSVSVFVGATDYIVPPEYWEDFE